MRGDSSVGIGTMLRAGRPGDRIPVEARFSLPVQIGSKVYLPYCTRASCLFPGDKAPGTWRWPAIPSSAEVKERAELHLYWSSEFSWLVIRWSLSWPLPLGFKGFRLGYFDRITGGTQFQNDRQDCFRTEWSLHASKRTRIELSNSAGETRHK